MAKQANKNGANLGFEAQLWATADKLRGNMEPSDYKHVALGLIFLKYISDAFEAKRAKLLTEELADAEDPEEYLAENVFWVPKEARWSHLRARAKQPTIGKDACDTVRLVRAWLARSGITEGRLFRSVAKSGQLGERLDPSQVPRIFKAMADRAGLPEALVQGLSGHSARVGAAQDMIAAGIELPAILQAGRWKSTAMVNRYGERLLARRSGAAQLARLQDRK